MLAYFGFAIRPYINMPNGIHRSSFNEDKRRYLKVMSSIFLYFPYFPFLILAVSDSFITFAD